MRDLDLLEQYLLRLRQEFLQASHRALIGGFEDIALREARGYALQAELCDRIRGSLKELTDDPAQFIKVYLS